MPYSMSDGYNKIFPLHTQSENCAANKNYFSKVCGTPPCICWCWCCRFRGHHFGLSSPCQMFEEYYSTADLSNKCQGLMSYSYILFTFSVFISGVIPRSTLALVFIESQLDIACIFISFSELQQQRIHIFMQAAQIFWQFTWHCIHHAPPRCSCRGFFVFWPTLQLETDDNKKLYYTQAHPFDLMAVECAAFNAGPRDGNELVGIGLSWVGFGLLGGGDGNVAGARSVGCVVCASGDHVSVHIFRFWGQESCWLFNHFCRNWAAFSSGSALCGV